MYTQQDKGIHQTTKYNTSLFDLDTTGSQNNSITTRINFFL